MILMIVDVSFYSREITRTTKFRLKLESESQFSKEGRWGAYDSTSKKLAKIYFGDDAGWWKWHSHTSTSDGRFNAYIRLLEYPRP